MAQNPSNLTAPVGLKIALNLAMAIFSLGLVLSLFVWRSGLASLDLYGNSFHVLYVRNEPVVFLLLFLALWLVRPYLLGDRVLAAWPSPLTGDRLAKFPWLWVIALSVVLLAWLGDYLVLHDFPLSNDEYLPRFQAQIFLAGKLKALLPPDLREFGQALTPIFAIFDPQEGTWISAYLPVYAALRTGFLALGVESLTGPALAGLSLVLIAAVARRLWPQESLAPLIAVILLASSTQFLITSMTSYAYPAHLCFNLAWLYFYCRGDRLGYLVTPWIGFFALGLHNPFVHALFVAPFLLALLWREKLETLTLLRAGLCRRLSLVVSLVDPHCSPAEGSEHERLSVFPGLPAFHSTDESCHAFCLAVSCPHRPGHHGSSVYWTRSDFPPCRPWPGAALLTFGFFFFFPWDQVLGWGYRFFYGVLGNLVLLAVAGWFYLKESLGLRKAWGFFVLGTALAVLVQFPLRCLQVESFIRPFARSAQYIQSLPYSFAIIDPTEVWFSQLLVRNDPFLRNHPKILFAPYLNEAQLAKLKTLGTVHTVKPEELAQLWPPPHQASP